MFSERVSPTLWQTLETNASMGLIVASPTAGSAGIVPGMMLALQEVYGFSDKKNPPGTI